MARKKRSPPRISEQISDFLNKTDALVSDYEWNEAEIQRLDRLTQDYLHRLELEDADYRARSRTATQLARCRQLRRESKDTIEILEPFISFITSEKGKNLINLMREALGKTRKAEERMTTKVYRYKEIDGEIQHKE